MKHLQTALYKTLLSTLATAFVVMGFTSTAWAQDEGTTVRDTGLDNLQAVARSSEDLSALAFIVQEGNGGSAAIIQQAGALAAGAELGEAHIRQFSGQGNEALIRQKGAADPHDHEIVQRGNRNTATIRARTAGQQGTVIQDGASNTVLLVQDGTAGSRALVRQEASGTGREVTGNLIEIYQGMGGDHILRAIQDGSHNTGHISQHGSGADAFLRQSGDRNTARIVQGINPLRGQQ